MRAHLCDAFDFFLLKHGPLREGFEFHSATIVDSFHRFPRFLAELWLLKARVWFNRPERHQ